MSGPVVRTTRSRAGGREEWTVAFDHLADVADLRDALAEVPAGIPVTAAQSNATGMTLELTMSGGRGAKTQRPSSRNATIPAGLLNPTAEEMDAARMQVAIGSTADAYRVLGMRISGLPGLIAAALRDGNVYFAAAELRWLIALDQATRAHRDDLDASTRARSDLPRELVR